MLFPTDKNLTKMFLKFCGPHMDINDIDEEGIKHFKLLFLHYNPISQRFHKHQTFLPGKVEQIKDKLLLLAGDCDRVAYSSELLRLIDDLGLNHRIFKNAGHVLNIEQADEVNKAIIQFLS